MTTMRTAGALVVLALVLTGTAGSAQSPRNGWVFQCFNGDANSPWLATVSTTGRMTTLITSGRVHATSMGYGLTMDVNNETYVVSLRSKHLKPSLLLVDQSGAILNTITVLPKPPLSGGDFVNDVVMNQDGDYVALVGPGAGTTRGLIKIARSGFARTPIFIGAPLGDPLGLAIDVESGDYIVLDSGALLAKRLWRVSLSGTTITTLAALPNSSYGFSYGAELTQLVRTGDYYVPCLPRQNADPAVLEVTQAGSIATFISRASFGVFGIEAGASSSTRPQVMLSMNGWQSGILAADVLTGAVTTLMLMPGTGLNAYGMYAIARNCGRHVATRKLSSGQWAVTVSFPSEAGNGYVAALSYSGTRPGFKLPDLRHVSFNPDKLTELSLNGSLALILRGNIGTLDKRGEARAILDVSKLPQLTGMRIWIQAMTLKPSAPSGISAVADPITLLL